MSLDKKLFVNISIQWVEKAATILLRIISFTIIARSLESADQLGRYSLVLALVAFFALLTDFGIDDTVVKVISTKPDKSRNLLANLAILKIILGTTASALMVFTAMALGYDSTLIVAILVGSIAIIINGFMSIAVDYYRINLLMKYVAFSNLASAVTLTIMVTIVSLNNGSVLSYVTAWSVSGLIGLSVIGIFFVQNHPLKWSGLDYHEWRKIIFMAMPLGTSYFLANISKSIDVVILSLMTDFKSTGIYGAAYRLLSVGSAFPFVFVSTIYPTMAKYWIEDKKNLQIIFQRSYDYLNILAWPLVGAIWMLAPKLMAIFFKKKEYISGAPALQLLAVALGIGFLSILVTFTLAAIDKQGALMKLSLTGVAVNILLNILLIPYYGYTASAAVTGISEMFILFPGLWIITRIPGFILSHRILPKSALVTTCGVITLYFTNNYSIFLQMLLFSIVFAMTVILTRSINIGELVAMVRPIQIGELTPSFPEEITLPVKKSETFSK